MCHGSHCTQVGHGAAHAAVAQRSLGPAFIGIRQVVGTTLHRVAELGCTRVGSSPAGNTVLIPRQVNSFGCELVGLVIPVLAGVGHHKAELPGLQVLVIGMQESLLVLLLEELVSAHGVMLVGQGLGQRGFLPGLATTPAGGQCHGQSLVLHLALFFVPDTVENLHTQIFLIRHQTTGQIQLKPLRVGHERLKELCLILAFCGHLGKELSPRHADELVHHGILQSTCILRGNLRLLQCLNQCGLNVGIITFFHGSLHSRGQLLTLHRRQRQLAAGLCSIHRQNRRKAEGKQPEHQSTCTCLHDFRVLYAHG